MSRNYRAEYDNYQGKPEQIRNRAQRNKARAMEMKKGRVHKGDGKDVDHKRPMAKGGKTTPGNLRIVSVAKNRSFPRDSKGHMK